MRKKIVWSLLGAAVLFLGIIGYYAYSFWSFADKISTEPKESRFKNIHTQNTSAGGGGVSKEELAPPKWEGKERVNVLLLGGDTRGLRPNEIPRSDSIMVASLDPVTKKSYLFSILRDTYVKIPGHGSDRINTAITEGGPELAMKTVSDLMGIKVQYYVYTDFNGFIALVDAMGGIEMDVEKDMKYQDAADKHEYDINLKKGLQHLDGKTALQYVRFRHDATSDFSRTERQRKFMKAVAEKLQTTSSLVKLPKILQAVDPYIETNLSVSNMLKLASLGFEVKTDGMVSMQIPPMDLLEEKRVGGAEVIGVNPAKLQTFLKGLFGDAEPASSSAPAATQKKSGVVSVSEAAAGAYGPPLKAGAAPTAKASAAPKATSAPKPSAATAKPTTAPTAKATAPPRATAQPSASAKATAAPKSTAPESPAATASPKPAASAEPKAASSGKAEAQASAQPKSQNEE